MDIQEMHIAFRELAQQMGMQTTRAILIEDIDICLNFAIINKARSILYENVKTLFSDKVAAQNAVISPINGLRTLYSQKDFTDSSINGEGSEVSPYQITVQTNAIEPNTKVMLYTGFKVSYNNRTMYDCRLIENENLGQTLRDFCNRAAKDAPIVTTLGTYDRLTVNIYTGRNDMPKPSLVRVLYIREPKKVKFDEDVVANRVDCDMPTHLHAEIVETAVNYYLRSISPGSSNNNNNRNN